MGARLNGAVDLTTENTHDRLTALDRLSMLTGRL